MLARRSRTAPSLAAHAAAPPEASAPLAGAHSAVSFGGAKPALRREIARRRRAEAELARARRDLEVFAYSLAHDLRTPLQAVSGFAQILLEEQRPSFGARSELLERIALAGARMQTVIDQMLAFAQPAKQDLPRRVVDLGDLAQEVAQRLQDEEPSRNVTWAIRRGIRCACNAALLREALTHLLANAWKYTTPVERPRIEFGVLRDRGGRRIFVRDNGIGFAFCKEDADHLPIARLDRGATLDGIGIGIPTARRIIERHGGTLRARSAPGRGALFTFTLGSPIECLSELPRASHSDSRSKSPS